jgi:hypothetical protein
MSFTIKKNNEVTYISQNSATTNSSSNTSTDNWSENGTSIYNNNTGNVGINTSNPLYNLDVSGNAIVRRNLHNSVLFVNSSTDLTTSSPNTVILFNEENAGKTIRLPNITSSNNGLLFTIRYFGTYSPAESNVKTFNDSNTMYIQNSGTTNISAFNTGNPITLVANNSLWYSV